MTFFRLGKREIHYKDTGEGEVVVLLHGLASCSEDWSSQIQALSKHYRVIAPDFRGHGYSSASAYPYTMRDLALDIRYLLTHIDVNSYHLVGFSLGGMVAFELALIDLQRLTSLSIINSAPGLTSSTWKLKIQLIIRKIVIAFMGMEKLGDIVSKKIFPEPQQNKLREKFISRMKEMGSRNYQYALHAISQFNVYKKISIIKQPTLIISSDQDYTPVFEKEKYAKLLKNAHIRVIKNSRHATPLDQPEVLSKALINFIDNNRSPKKTMKLVSL